MKPIMGTFSGCVVFIFIIVHHSKLDFTQNIGSFQTHYGNNDIHTFVVSF